MTLGYAIEKFGVAVNGMAVGLPRLQDRLAHAYGDSIMHGISDARHFDYLPPDMMERLTALEARMTSGTPTYGEGSIRATTDAMSDEEAQEIAQTIVDLDWELRALNRDR
jgi:hypothetical protein